jgi:hypothetical protein
MSVLPPNEESSATPHSLTLFCVICSQSVSAAADSDILYCPTCEHGYGLRPCEHCGAVNQVVMNGGRSGPWVCVFCRIKNPALPLIGLGTATVAQRAMELEKRGVEPGLDELKMVGGFTIVGGNGFGLKPSSVCSVLTRPDAAYVHVEIGEGRGRAVTIPYDVMTALDVAGGAKTTGRAFIGGGFGLQGVLEGMLVAAALNQAMKRTTMNTGMHIGATNGEILLHHGSLDSQAIRRTLSPLWTRWEAAKRSSTTPSAQPVDDHVQLLARLGELRDAGVLTEEEFAAKKAEILARL